jgi:hypothetical protein
MRQEDLVPYQCYRVYRDGDLEEYWDVVYIKPHFADYTCMVIRADVTGDGDDSFDYGDMKEFGMYYTEDLPVDEDAIRMAKLLTL